MAYVSTSRSKTALEHRYNVSFFDLLSLYRQRRALARLDARALDDIGLTPVAAAQEAKRGFWDVPNHWRT